MVKMAFAMLTITLLSISPFAMSANPERGKLLYKNHCIKCHTSGVHIRKKRKAKNIGDITYQVNRWVTNNKLDWTQNEIDDVVRYLNTKYYGYSK
jgi:mono/diheme cytochrome c family protein